MKRLSLLVVDDFLDDPDRVRATALRQTYVKMHAAGVRTMEQFLDIAPYRSRITALLGQELTDWNNAANGRFQCCTATDAIPFHSDSQSAAGVLYLTPDAPVGAGTSFYRGRSTGVRRRVSDAVLMEQTFGLGAEFDPDRWEEVDRVGNVYNRLVLFDAHLAHAATAYFGTSVLNGRLFQNFFFDLAGDLLAFRS